MDLDYFLKINNTYESQNKQETDLFLLNRYMEEIFDDTIDYHKVKKNGLPYELLIIKDTDGNTFKKKIKSRPSQPFNLGDYIEWNNQIWLVSLLNTDDKTYHSGYMFLCTVPLRWQNQNGDIIERWAYSEDFTKYSSGIKGNNSIIVGDNQYGLTIPIDNETKLLKRDIRFPIDFEDSELPDIYKLTNRKVQLNNNQYFGRGGTMIVTLSFGGFNKDTDKRITLESGIAVWICDYNNYENINPPPTPPVNPVFYSVVIRGNKTIKVGYPRTYTVEFKDVDGNIIENVDFKWNVESLFTITKDINGQSIKLEVNNENYIGNSFLLQVIADNLVISEIEIKIIDIV